MLSASAIPVISGVVSLVVIEVVVNVGALGDVSSAVVKLRVVVSLIPAKETPFRSSNAVDAICT